MKLGSLGRLCAATCLAVLTSFIGMTSVVRAETNASSAQASVTSEAEAKAETEKAAAHNQALMATLRPQRGVVRLAEAEATLNLGSKYYFLDAGDSRKVLIDEWGNPPTAVEGVLGMIIPEGSTPNDSWAAVVSYEKTGYVADKDADKTNYDDYIKQIQDGEAEDNSKRKEGGYKPTHLVGWAQPPSYDRARHYLIWARDIKFGDDPVDTLNYDVRLLGRYGVLSLNMVATIPELTQVRTDALDLAKAGQYNSGAGYNDFKNGDAMAEYGIGGLIAAGLGLVAAKKLGLLALILAFGKKAIVLVLAGLAVVGRWLSGLFGKKPKSPVVTKSAMDEQQGATPDTEAIIPETPSDPSPPAPES